MLKEIVVGEYTIKELTLGDMRKIQKDSQGEDLQYWIAANTICKDGKAIGMDALDAMPMSEAMKLIELIVEINASGDEKNV
jgi:hypothetical protein